MADQPTGHRRGTNNYATHARSLVHLVHHLSRFLLFESTRRHEPSISFSTLLPSTKKLRLLLTGNMPSARQSLLPRSASGKDCQAQSLIPEKISFVYPVLHILPRNNRVAKVNISCRQPCPEVKHRCCKHGSWMSRWMGGVVDHFCPSPQSGNVHFVRHKLSKLQLHDIPDVGRAVEAIERYESHQRSINNVVLHDRRCLRFTYTSYLSHFRLFWLT